MKPIDALEHITKDGERWDTLAWRYYGNPHAYGPIIEANPAFDIGTLLPGGRLLLIPIMTVEQAQELVATDDLPPWKR